MRRISLLAALLVACGSSDNHDDGQLVIVRNGGAAGTTIASAGAAGHVATAGAGPTNAGNGGSPITTAGHPSAGNTNAGSTSAGNTNAGNTNVAGTTAAGHASGGAPSAGSGGNTNAAGAPSAGNASAGNTNEAGAGGSDGGGSGGSGPSCAPVTLDPTLTFNLDNGAFPGSGHPDVAVHVPPGFLPCEKPSIIVWFHGFDNCVVNAIGSVDTACTPGGAVRTAHHLSDQLDASKANAILVAVELDFDQATGDPGALADDNRLYDLLHELLTEHLDDQLGVSLDVADLDRVVLGTHSGGYSATQAVLAKGGVSQITEVDLYDSLYGYESVFEGWIGDNVTRFDESRADRYRWTDVYTDGGGTLENSQDMAKAVQSTLDDAMLSSSETNDLETDTLADAAFDVPVLFKSSMLSHDGVPQYYFGIFTAHAGFAKLP